MLSLQFNLDVKFNLYRRNIIVDNLHDYNNLIWMLNLIYNKEILFEIVKYFVILQ